MLERRKESDTYLATDSRHRDLQTPGMCIVSNQLMKASVTAESYTLYPLSSSSADSGDVYCQ